MVGVQLRFTHPRRRAKNLEKKLIITRPLARTSGEAGPPGGTPGGQKGSLALLYLDIEARRAGGGQKSWKFGPPPLPNTPSS